MSAGNRGRWPRRLVGLSAAVPALVAPTACAVDETPPELVSARFEEAGVLALRFSEAMGPVGDVDPSGHFRLGASLVVESEDGSSNTIYYDLAHHFPEGIPGAPPAEPSLDDPIFRHAFSIIAGIERGARDDELRLLLSYPVEDYVCEALAEAESLGIPAAVHLHYSQASRPRIVDEAGNALEDMGAWWVTAFFAEAQAGVWPELELRLPIPCPE